MYSHVMANSIKVKIVQMIKNEEGIYQMGEELTEEEEMCNLICRPQFLKEKSLGFWVLHFMVIFCLKMKYLTECWLVVFYVPWTVRSFKDGTPIYCPLRRTCSSVFTPFPPGIEPRPVAWQSITYHCATPAPLLTEWNVMFFKMTLEMSKYYWNFHLAWNDPNTVNSLYNAEVGVHSCERLIEKNAL